MKNLEEKRVMIKSLDHCWKKWQEEHPEKSISYGQFCKLRPTNIKTQAHRKLLQCLCEYCENVRLKLKTLNALADKNNKPDLIYKDIYNAADHINFFHV